MRLINGEGPVNAKILIVGEAPGKQEELEGRPFVGRSGYTLMDALLENGISREDVYITNLVKVRPPNNRDPHSSDIDKFLPLLRKEIEIIQPKVVIALGRIAAASLIGNNFKITRDRGIIHPTNFNYTVLPTFHPAYVNRNPDLQEIFKNDIKRAINRAYE